MESAATPRGLVPGTGPESLASQARFLREADKLKTVFRQSTIIDATRKENSAEHSWHLAMMALVLAEHAPPGTDLGRVTAMVLLHDLVEIDAGDLFVYADAEEQARQEEAERAAADRIFALLPAGPGGGVPRAVGRVRGAPHAGGEVRPGAGPAAADAGELRPGGGTWAEHGITADQVLAKVRADRGRLRVARALRHGSGDPRGGRRLPAPAR